MLPDLNKLPKDKRDWLEIYGNQYRPARVMPGTCEACIFGSGEHNHAIEQSEDERSLSAEHQGRSRGR